MFVCLQRCWQIVWPLSHFQAYDSVLTSLIRWHGASCLCLPCKGSHCEDLGPSIKAGL